MIDYYTMESVRDYLIAKNYEIKSAGENSIPLPGWNRCPCCIQKSCERKSQLKCVGYVSIFVNTDKVKWLNLEICFFRGKERAFIRTEGLQMKKLFELGIIPDKSLLKKETF